MNFMQIKPRPDDIRLSELLPLTKWRVVHLVEGRPWAGPWHHPWIGWAYSSADAVMRARSELSCIVPSSPPFTLHVLTVIPSW